MAGPDPSLRAPSFVGVGLLVCVLFLAACLSVMLPVSAQTSDEASAQGGGQTSAQAADQAFAQSGRQTSVQPAPQAFAQTSDQTQQAGDPALAGQPSVVIRFVTPAQVVETASAPYEGRAGRAIRDHMDANRDGKVTQSEVDDFRAQVAKTIGNSTSGAQFQIDGQTDDAREARLESVEGGVGPVNRTDPVVLRIARSLHFPVADADRHILTSPAVSQSNARPALVVFQAPPGFHFSSHTAFPADATLSANATEFRFLEGQEPHDAQELVFERETKTAPGPGIPLLLGAGLVAIVVLRRRASL